MGGVGSYDITAGPEEGSYRTSGGKAKFFKAHGLLGV